MNWLVFAVSAYLCLALQAGLRPLLALPSLGSGVYPRFSLVLLVFVSMQTRRGTALAAGVVLGLLVDLLPGPDGMVVVGPTALAYLGAAYAAGELRAFVYPRSTLAVASLVIPAGVLGGLIEVAIYSFRQGGLLSAEPIDGWSVWGALGVQVLCVIYSALLALPLGALFLRTLKFWNFPAQIRANVGSR